MPDWAAPVAALAAISAGSVGDQAESHVDAKRRRTARRHTVAWPYVLCVYIYIYIYICFVDLLCYSLI